MATAQRIDLLLRHRKLLAVSDANLPLDEVDAGDHLGDRVLDLQSRVHLQEEELAVLVDELDGAGVVVADGTSRLNGGFTHCCLDACWERGCWCFFDELLVSSLGGAVA